MEQPIALIVDDEPDIRELLAITLSRMNIQSQAAEDISEAKKLLKTQRFDLCLTDLQLPDGDGLELVEHIQKHAPYLPTAVITAFGSMETAINALKLGAFDFVSKPVDLKSLKNLVNSAIKINDKVTPVDRRSRDTLLGDSIVMAKVRAKIAKLARSQAPVYISGESGTGKELVAKLIHQKGPRAHETFVPINCGAIPQELMESEFFGHKKGSFTGAVSDKKGLFQTAHGGTLFLDEVADLPLQMQVKLLRAIQEKSIRPVGSEYEVPIDVRILSATHKNLNTLVDEGKFRQDLFYRINVIELPLPNLNERKEDLPVLCEHFLKQIADSHQDVEKTLSKPALNRLMSYSFPGNVRELENILERVATMSEGNEISETELHLPETNKQTPPQSSPILQDEPLEDYLVQLEKEAICTALENNRWNKTATAKELGISFRALRYRLKKLGIDE